MQEFEIDGIERIIPFILIPTAYEATAVLVEVERFSARWTHYSLHDDHSVLNPKIQV